MSRRARGTCPDLDALLEAHGPDPITPALRKRIAAHTEMCETCNAQRRKLVSATTLLRAVPIVPLPLIVKQRVGEAAAEAICANAASAGASGAGASSTDGRSWWQRTRSRANGAKVAAIAGVAIFAAFLFPAPARLETPAPPEAAVSDTSAQDHDVSEPAQPASNGAPLPSPSATGRPAAPPSRSAVPAAAASPPAGGAAIAAAEIASATPTPAWTATPAYSPTSQTLPSATPTRRPRAGASDDGSSPTPRPEPSATPSNVPGDTATPQPTETPTASRTATPRPSETPEHCECRWRGDGHDACDGDDDDDDDDDHGRRIGHR